MLGKVITDVMFISYFEEKENKETEKALIFTSIALAPAEVGALLFVPTAGVSEVIAIKPLVIGVFVEAGAIHFQGLLNDDQSKLKKAKRDAGADNLKLELGFDKHLIEVEDIVWKKGKGIVGVHNLDHFENAFKSNGWI